MGAKSVGDYLEKHKRRRVHEQINGKKGTHLVSHISNERWKLHGADHEQWRSTGGARMTKEEEMRLIIVMDLDIEGKVDRSPASTAKNDPGDILQTSKAPAIIAPDTTISD